MHKWTSLGLTFAATALAATPLAAQQASPNWSGFYVGLNAGGMFGNTSANFAGPGGPGGLSGSGGGFVGGGVEGMITDRWSTKLEYLYMGTPSVSVSGPGTTSNGNLIRLGVNYHF